MNSTNIPYEDKKRMFELASKRKINIFMQPDEKKESYYINYKESKHLEKPFQCYDSSELDIFRTCIKNMFGDKEFKEIAPIILAIYMHTREKNVNRISKIDLNNYMM